MWALTIKNLVFPIFCKQCGIRLMTEENGFFCPTCWELPLRIEPPFCTRCGRPHPKSAGFGPVANFPCAECNAQTEAPPYRRVFGAMVYEGAAAEAVKILKFYERRWVIDPMVDELRAFIEDSMDTERYDLITPVPLHAIRLRDRGFNQSQLMVDELADLFPNATVTHDLKRIRPTRVQSRISDPLQREANVRGAFAVDQNVSFEGKRILVVDDVVTTGGTVAQCASALHRAGAEEVDVLAFALSVQGHG